MRACRSQLAAAAAAACRRVAGARVEALTSAPASSAAQASAPAPAASGLGGRAPPRGALSLSLAGARTHTRAAAPAMADDAGVDPVGFVPDGFTVVREGKAAVLQRAGEVFYNKAQVINRDLSKACLRLFSRARDAEAKDRDSKDPSGRTSRRRQRKNGPPGDPLGLADVTGMRVLEGLAASGLRAIRYVRELGADELGCVVANDIEDAAVEAMRRNLGFNGMAADGSGRVRPLQSDVRATMLSYERAFDAVDLDPYGTPSTFLDGAVQCVADGGLLLCTATDMAVLCGNTPEVCWSKYGAYPLKGEHCHEQALRVLLYAIETAANRHGRHIQPLLSVSIDFYVRVFVRVYTSSLVVKQAPSKMAYLHQAVGSKSFELSPVGRVVQKNGNPKHAAGHLPASTREGGRSEICGSPIAVGGPMWSGPIHDMGFVKDLLAELKSNDSQYPAAKKVRSILTAVSEELTDAPLYWNLHSMSGALKCTPPAYDVYKSAIINAGYRASGTHASPLGIKTDAPPSLLWDILRVWVKDHPIKPQSEESVSHAVLSVAPTHEVNFARAQGSRSKAKDNREARFLPNPQANWGPMPRAGSKRAREIAEQDAAAAAENGQKADATPGAAE